MIIGACFPELCGSYNLQQELNSDPSTPPLGRVRERVQFAYNKRVLQLLCQIGFRILARLDRAATSTLAR